MPSMKENAGCYWMVCPERKQKTGEVEHWPSTTRGDHTGVCLRVECPANFTPMVYKYPSPFSLLHHEI